MFNDNINELLNYGIENKLIKREDKVYSANLLLGLFKEDKFEESDETSFRKLEEILESLVSYAVDKKLIDDTLGNRELFDVKIMNILIDRPSNVINKFRELYDVCPEKATNYYYDLSLKSNYIREYRIKKDIKWKTNTKYGKLDLNINLSKPEKDPKDIINASKVDEKNYPKCYICKENEGFAGRIDYTSKENLRLIPVNIGDEKWYMQYSPYVYYNEHCILFSEEHKPMEINGDTFGKLFDFVNQYPHYFIGSNAGLPIVGGSILNHLHYQGGRYEFPIFNAKVEEEVYIEKFKDVKLEILKWPLTVFKLSSNDYLEIIKLGKKILSIWGKYTDEKVNIIAKSKDEKHNTITPIVRKNSELYELYIALRNNITTKDRHMGYFHPRKDYHNIKKENIGLIEVMGLAVLPGRLKEEMEIIKEYILQGKVVDNEIISKHDNIVQNLKDNRSVTSENIELLIQKNIGHIFSKILEDTGVFKRNEEGKVALLKFLNKLK